MADATSIATPPEEPARNHGGRPPEKTEKAIAFLTEKLSQSDRKANELINEWVALGQSKSPIFGAKRAMEKDGLLVVDDSKKPQIWHLVRSRVGNGLERVFPTVSELGTV